MSVSRKGCWEKKTTLSEVPSSVPLFPGNFIHGTHGVFRLLVIVYRLKVMFRVACARNLGGNLHVKSEDLNGPEIYLR